jgi:hypothetical protein
MKIRAMVATAALMLTASPASVVPDTFHKVAHGTGQVVKGTYHGVAHQAGNVGYAARSTGHSISRGVHRVVHHHPRRHYVHHHD